VQRPIVDIVTSQQDDGLASDDVLEQGHDRWSAPSWWPFRGPSWWPPKISRPAAVVSLVALVLGLGVGYLAGSRHTTGGTTGGATPPAAAGRGRASAQPASLGGPTLEQTSNECSAQHGTTLQLGIEISNLSGSPLTLGQVKAFTPAGGLRVTAVSWGSCGELPNLSLNAPLKDATDQYLPPGASGWLTVTAAVLVHCPGPDPVQFSVGYLQRGRYRQILLPGFPDLSGVSYTGCQN
jgi:hypothetical protein